MIPLTDNENKYYEEQKECYICQKEFCCDKNQKMKFKLYKKVRDHCHYTGKFRGAAHSICNLNYKVPQEIPVKIHNGSKYDYHFIIKELAEEFKGEFECLGENTEKYIRFSVPIKKEHNNSETMTYKIMFFDTCRFMSSKLSDLVDNLSEININFAMVILINLFCYEEKVFILMSISTGGKDLLKHHYHLQKIFIVN